MSKGSEGQKFFNPDQALMAPIKLPHPWNTLSAAESKMFMASTGVKCKTRARPYWGEGKRLTLLGHPDLLLRAKAVVMEFFEQQPNPDPDAGAGACAGPSSSAAAVVMESFEQQPNPEPDAGAGADAGPSSSAPTSPSHSWTDLSSTDDEVGPVPLICDIPTDPLALRYSWTCGPPQMRKPKSASVEQQSPLPTRPRRGHSPAGRFEDEPESEHKQRRTDSPPRQPRSVAPRLRAASAAASPLLGQKPGVLPAPRVVIYSCGYEPLRLEWVDPQLLAWEILSRLDIPFGIVMDCNGFPNEHPLSCPGLNALAMARVATDPAFRNWLQFAKTMLTTKGLNPKSLQEPPEHDPLLNLITVCRDGVHRSVACAELLASVLLQQGWRVHVEHMHQERWGKCKGDCKRCLSFDHVKAEAFEHALTIWRLV